MGFSTATHGKDVMKVSVLMPFRPSDDPWRHDSSVWVVQRLVRSHPDWELVFGDRAGEFNRGASINDAAAMATGDIYAIVDSDTFTNNGFAAEALGLVVKGAPWAYPYGRYYNLCGYKTREILDSSPIADFARPNPDEVEFDLSSTSGFIFMDSKAYEEMGGFDERFIGWGGEDVAFFEAAKAVLGMPPRIDGWVGHLWHGSSEATRFGQPYWPHNARLVERYRRMGNFPNDMKQYVKERPTNVED